MLKDDDLNNLDINIISNLYYKDFVLEVFSKEEFGVIRYGANLKSSDTNEVLLYLPPVYKDEKVLRSDVGKIKGYCVELFGKDKSDVVYVLGKICSFYRDKLVTLNNKYEQERKEKEGASVKIKEIRKYYNDIIDDRNAILKQLTGYSCVIRDYDTGEISMRNYEMGDL